MGVYTWMCIRMQVCVRIACAYLPAAGCGRCGRPADDDDDDDDTAAEDLAMGGLALFVPSAEAADDAGNIGCPPGLCVRLCVCVYVRVSVCVGVDHHVCTRGVCICPAHTTPPPP